MRGSETEGDTDWPQPVPAPVTVHIQLEAAQDLSCLEEEKRGGVES